MFNRISYITVAPDAMEAFGGGAKYLAGSSIKRRLRYLVELRVSQINGCAYCIDLHSKQLRKEGETDRRIDCLSVWDEVQFYTDREKAALEWAEAVTRIEGTRVPDEVYERVSAHFGEKEMVDLTLTVANMNFWNRIAISFRRQPPGKSG
jgi:AhpD family alkylhydroperoxidase